MVWRWRRQRYVVVSRRWVVQAARRAADLWIVPAGAYAAVVAWWPSPLFGEERPAKSGVMDVERTLLGDTSGVTGVLTDEDDPDPGTGPYLSD